MEKVSVREMLTEILKHYNQRETEDLLGVAYDTLRPWIRESHPVRPSNIEPIKALYRAVTSNPPEKVNWSLIVKSLVECGISEDLISKKLGVEVRQVKSWGAGARCSRGVGPRKLAVRKNLLKLHKKSTGRAT